MKWKVRTSTLIRKLEDFFHASRPEVILAIETVLGILLCLLSLAIFLYFTSEMLEADFNALDVSVSHAVYALRSPALTKDMLFFTMLGSPMTLTVLMLVTILILMKNHRKEAFIFCITLLMGSILSIILKQTIQRPRPQLSPLIVEHMYSFPSAHAMNSFIFLALISYFSFHFFRNKTLTLLTILFSAMMVFLIGFSRIYLGVHYFTDVVAGYIAGFWWFVTVLLIDRTFIFYKIFKKSES